MPGRTRKMPGNKEEVFVLRKERVWMKKMLAALCCAALITGGAACGSPDVQESSGGTESGSLRDGGNPPGRKPEPA